MVKHLFAFIILLFLKRNVTHCQLYILHLAINRRRYYICVLLYSPHFKDITFNFILHRNIEHNTLKFNITCNFD